MSDAYIIVSQCKQTFHLLLSSLSPASAITHTLTHAEVMINFTLPLYDVSEDVGDALVEVTLTSGSADRDIEITIISIAGSADGKQ